MALVKMWGSKCQLGQQSTPTYDSHKKSSIEILNTKSVGPVSRKTMHTSDGIQEEEEKKCTQIHPESSVSQRHQLSANDCLDWTPFGIAMAAQNRIFSRIPKHQNKSLPNERPHRISRSGRPQTEANRRRVVDIH